MKAQDRHTNSGLGRLAEYVYSHRRLVIAGWIGLLVVIVAITPAIKGEFSANYYTPGSDSRGAAELVEERFPEQNVNTVDVVWAAKDVTAPAVTNRVERLLAEMQQVEAIGDGTTTRDAQVAPDKSVAVVRLPPTVQRFDDFPEESGHELLALGEAANGDGLRVELSGTVIESVETSEEASSEAIGLAFALIVLLFTFGSLVAAGMPIGAALVGLGISSSLIGVVAAVMDVPDWALSVAAMIGIGVGIDYALLIVTRFRAALAENKNTREALVEAVSTAGHSVLVAGGTVVVSLMGLFLMGLEYLQGVAVAATLSVLVVMLASVTLVPALLAASGTKVNRLRMPGTRNRRGESLDGPAARWSRTVQRRPLVATAAGLAILAVLAAPVTGLRLGFPDAGNNPEDTTSRQAYDLLADGFGPGAAGPLFIATTVDERGDQIRLAGLVRGLKAEDGVGSVSAPALNSRGDTALVTVAAKTSPQSTETAQLIERIRDDVVPASGLDAKVGGSSASFVDMSEATGARLPVFIATVVGLAFLLLLATFKAPLVALKAGVLNVISIGAAYGVVALAADGGAFGQLIGIEAETPVPPFIPVLMFAILFGLSMDYEVFLISRIREAFLGGQSTSEAVTEGLARTARVITAAATIMVAVFGAFVLAPDVVTKLIGLGLAAAILIDATVVRMLLVPALMELLGDRNWWLPTRLARRLGEAQLETPTHAPAQAGA